MCACVRACVRACACEKPLEARRKGLNVGWGALRESSTIYSMCVFIEYVCPIYCKPRCNPEQEAGQGVTVGVKAPLLPWNTAVDCFTQCLLIWSPYWVSVPWPTKRLQPPSQGQKPTNHTLKVALCWDTMNQFSFWKCEIVCSSAEIAKW